MEEKWRSLEEAMGEDEKTLRVWGEFKKLLSTLGKGVDKDFQSGVLTAVCSFVSSLFYIRNTIEALLYVLHFVPDTFNVGAIPKPWITGRANEMEWEFDVNDHPKPLTAALGYLQLNGLGEHREEFIVRWLWIISMCEQFYKDLPKGKRRFIFSETPYNCGSQHILNFSVQDLRKPDDPTLINWHGQNRSQWAFAGAMVITKEGISVHT